ncbi:MAG: site-specific integrase [Candidatus Thiodiazotropha sp.]|jgi:integrase
MASIAKTPDGTYRVKIRRKGYPAVSKNFEKKTHAQRWATQIEAEMAKGIFVSTDEAETTTMAVIFDQYGKEVVPTKKSHIDIKYRLKRLKSHFGDLTIARLTSMVIKKYRDDRLKEVKAPTVRKELGILRSVIAYAQKELEIHLPKGNPMRLVAIPDKGLELDRRLLPGEEQKLFDISDEYGGYIPHLIRLAIETAMRGSELLKLRWEDIDFNLKRSVGQREGCACGGTGQGATTRNSPLF